MHECEIVRHYSSRYLSVTNVPAVVLPFLELENNDFLIQALHGKKRDMRGEYAATSEANLG